MVGEKESLNSISSGKIYGFQFFEYICLYIFKKDLSENKFWIASVDLLLYIAKLCLADKAVETLYL